MGLLDFASIKNSVHLIGDRLKVIRVEINDKQRERLAITSAPLCKSDLKDMLSARVEQSNRTYVEALESALTKFAANPRNFEVAPNDQSAPRLVGALAAWGHEPSSLDVDKAVCGLFGIELLKTLHSVVDRMDLPNTGSPMSRRKAEVEKIDRKLHELLQEETSLIEQAADAGITLNHF